MKLKLLIQTNQIKLSMKAYTTIIIVLFMFFMACNTPAPFIPDSGPVEQLAISRIEAMPNLPEPYKYKDWKQTALDFDKYVYDFSQKGEFLPLIWLDPNKRNFDQSTFGIYTALGDVRQGPEKNNGEAHEALGVLGSILGATLVGIDKSKQDGNNYVRMARNYFNKETGWYIIMNFTTPSAHIGGGYGNDYWYDVFNNVLFYAIGNYYPNEKGYDEILRTLAEQYYKSDSVLAGNYSHSFFDFKNMAGGKNHIPPQEDVAAGYAFILYSAYVKYGDPRYLEGAKRALTALQGQTESRFWEILMPFGAYVGARLNAEKGTDYDLKKFIDWTFDGTATNREGWGVLLDNWGGYDVSGICGSTVHNGGYGFLMNTFDLAWPLTAMLRYDQRYSRSVGKWILNASNAARFFYPYEMPDSLQALPDRKAITNGVIAYEGLIKESTFDEYKGITPFAQGDGPRWAPGMPPETMFSIYGSAHVGLFGGIIRPTNVDRILQVDCLKLDMYRNGETFPTYLYYNPYSESKEVKMELSDGKFDIYDSVNREFVARNISRTVNFKIEGDKARLLVLVPSGAKYVVTNGKLTVNGVIIDYRY